jgi:hypothetical protein
VVITTGADSTHFLSLMQLLCSIRRECRNWEGLRGVLVWDLGLAQYQRALLELTFPEFKFESFNFEKYPDWMHIKNEAGQYAWKPLAINRAYEKYSGKCSSLLWLDAGDRLTSAPTELISIIERVLVYSPISDGNVLKWTHRGMLDYFKISLNSQLLTAQNRNGAVIGFNTSSSLVVNFIRSFAHYATIKEAIYPLGSSRQNHRQDQALFTLLYYFFKSKFKIESVNSLVNVEIHCDIDHPLNVDREHQVS